MDTLALTDRDGTYGAVRFAKACLRPGSGRCSGWTSRSPRPGRPGGPVGRPGAGRRRDPGPRRGVPRPAAAPGDLPGRRAGRAGRRCAGWCRPPTWPGSAATRSAPSTWSPSTPPAGASWSCSDRPRSSGAAATARRDDLRAGRRCGAGGSCSTPPTSWSRWSTTGCPARARARRRTPPGCSGWPGPTGPGAVLSNAVRYADRADAVVVDVLDAARRLVPLDLRHVDRGNAEGFLKSGKEMAEVAEEVGRARRAAGSARRASCWPTPGWWPTGAPSTRAPTSAWGRCTSPSSGSTRGRGRARRRRRRGAAVPVRGGHRPSLRQRARGSGSGSGSTTSCG